MPPVITEMFRSTEGNLEKRSIEYLVSSVGDEQEAIDAIIGSVPFRLPTNDFFVMDDIDVMEIDKKACEATAILPGLAFPVGGLPDSSVKDGWYRCTVHYVNETSLSGNTTPPSPDDGGEPPDMDDEETRLKKHTFNQSLENVQEFTNLVGPSRFYSDATAIPGAVNLSRGINPRGENGDFEGVSVRRPIGSFVVSFYPSVSWVTNAYMTKVKSLVGKVNSVPFYGYTTYEVLLVSVQGKGINDNRYELEFTFEVRESKSDQVIKKADGSDIKYDILGHEYAWVLYKEELVDEEVQQVPRSVCIESLYEQADLNELFNS